MTRNFAMKGSVQRARLRSGACVTRRIKPFSPSWLSRVLHEHGVVAPRVIICPDKRLHLSYTGPLTGYTAQTLRALPLCAERRPIELRARSAMLCAQPCLTALKLMWSCSHVRKNSFQAGWVSRRMPRPPSCKRTKRENSSMRITIRFTLSGLDVREVKILRFAQWPRRCLIPRRPR